MTFSVDHLVTRTVLASDFALSLWRDVLPSGHTLPLTGAHAGQIGVLFGIAYLIREFARLRSAVSHLKKPVKPLATIPSSEQRKVQPKPSIGKRRAKSRNRAKPGAEQKSTCHKNRAA